MQVEVEGEVVAVVEEVAPPTSSNNFLQEASMRYAAISSHSAERHQAVKVGLAEVSHDCPIHIVQIVLQMNSHLTFFKDTRQNFLPATTILPSRKVPCISYARRSKIAADLCPHRMMRTMKEQLESEGKQERRECERWKGHNLQPSF